MPNQNKIKTVYDVSNESIWVIDDSGLYSVNNTGGFGDPNNELNEVALICVLQFFDDGTSISPTLLSSSSVFYSSSAVNEDTVEFQFKYHTDGHYQATILLIPASNDGVNFVDGSVIGNNDYYYNTTDETVYQLVDTVSNEISDLKTLIDLDGGPTQATCEPFYVIKSQTYANKIYGDIIELRVEGGNDIDSDKYMQLLNVHSLINNDLQGIISLFHNGMTINAQENIKKLMEAYDIE